MSKRIRKKALKIDDHSGLNIDGVIKLLDNQYAGKKHISRKPIIIDKITPDTEPTPVKITRTSTLRFKNQKRRFNNKIIYHNV